MSDFSIFNNPKATEAVKDFVASPNVNKLVINCNSSLFMDFSMKGIKNISNSSIFVINAPEITDMETAIRQSTKLTFKVTKNIYEGEVIALDKSDMTLMTSKDTKKIKVMECEELKYIRVGDIVYIEASLGIIRRLGRSENRIDEYDLEGNRYVSLSKNSVHQIKEKECELSLYDLDCSYSKRNNCKIDARVAVNKFIRNNKQKLIINPSIIIIKNSETLPLSAWDVIKECSLKFVKFILIGDFKSEIDSDFLSIKIDDDFEPLEYLKVLSDKICDETYFNIAKVYLNKQNYSVISKMLNLSTTPEQFQNYMRMQFEEK